MRGEPPVNTPEQIDDDIWRHHLEGSPIRKIATITHTVAARRDGQASSNVIGRPQRVTPSIVESVVSLTLNYGSISCPRISQIIRSQTGVMLCTTSIRKIRRENKLSWGKA
jgi:hypothetical protein